MISGAIIGALVAGLLPYAMKYAPATARGRQGEILQIAVGAVIGLTLGIFI
ncbi:MAG: hypothetical protein AAF415_03100 [Pseudomonadota bacterium]